MCGTCGCDGVGAMIQRYHEHGDGYGHGPGVHAHEHVIAPPDDRTVMLQQKVLAKNDRIAELNRAWTAERDLTMVNLMSSPGAGKTTLLERTARELAGQPRICVIEGDQETALDASRISAAGCPVVQINTGAGCHLDAEMVAAALAELDPAAGSIVVIENVGNLVCPALFDLGEARRVVLASVTEGEDKPVKYPHMFRQADLVLVSKVDLLPYLTFDLTRYTDDVARIAPAAQLMTVSAVSGEGMPAWCDWLSAAG
jgi:hydrogenase nickel incorporation protein HypB